MRPTRTFTVAPCLPPAIERLAELAHNLRWSWNTETVELFRRLDRELWESTGHNPVALLGTISQDRLAAAAADDAFCAHLERVCRELDAYMAAGRRWYGRTFAAAADEHIAYFSAEYGITEALPMYSGGLGILAGDHLKSASDLGVPLVAVGLLYQHGYLTQYLNAEGWQQERYPVNDFYTLPLCLERAPSGARLTVSLEYPGRVVLAQVWRAQVGRVPLYLLDTNLPENAPADRAITDRLYGGDIVKRIEQELLLGVGGVRALAALGIEPTAWHLNEGHAAFLTLEHIRTLIERHGLSFAEAREAAAAGSLFTTHTPVPAGLDRFPPELAMRYLGPLLPGLGISAEELLALGRENPADPGSPFGMAVLAIRLCARTNAVSRLHGAVSRRLFHHLWPSLPEEEVPIASLTNGVHLRSWISHDLAALHDRYLGPRWVEDPTDPAVWDRLQLVPDEELWRTHERRRERLVAFARRRLATQLAARGAGAREMRKAQEALDPDALTIGFARRFATYKRATLLLRDPERLGALLAGRERPVQMVVAGKAHPQDTPGKELIRDLVRFARDRALEHRLVFLEDYDMSVARYLVQGADVWLATPRRPREACSTSGMKAAANGALNLAIPDGWWDEAGGPETGWVIGAGEVYEDPDYQDEVEARATFELLEKEVVPLFYERGSDGLPRGWIARMKTAMRAVSMRFNSHRMVAEYTERFYRRATERTRSLLADGQARARELARWKAHLGGRWSGVAVEKVEGECGAGLRVGDRLAIRVRVRLGDLTPQDVAVEVYHGVVNGAGTIEGGTPLGLDCQGTDGDGVHVYTGEIPCLRSGRQGFAVRLVPRHPELGSPYELGLVTWG